MVPIIEVTASDSKRITESLTETKNFHDLLKKFRIYLPYFRYIVVAKIMFRYKDYMQRLGFRANPFGDI